MSATPYDLSFFAPGVPAPKGSLDAKPIPGSRKVYMVAGNQVNQDKWASAVRDAARDAMPDHEYESDRRPYAGDVEVIVRARLAGSMTRSATSFPTRARVTSR
jgi:hypothetical protein